MLKVKLAVFLVLFTTLFAACGGGAAPADQAAGATQPPAAQPVTITYAFWDANQKPAIEAQIAAFQRLNPTITVEPQVIPWGDYWTKLQTAVAGGSAFDVFWMNGPNFPVYASQGVLADLSTLGVDTKVFPSSLINLYSFQGKLFAIPKDFDTIALYYNKALFDAAKVPYPSDEWTWQDLREAAKKLTIREGDQVTQWGFAASTANQVGYWNFIYQNGGQALSADGSQALLDQPAACEGVLFVYDILQDGSSPSAAEQLANDPFTSLFPGGKIAMTLGGSWMAKTYHEANAGINVAPLPRGKQRASMIHGLGQAVWSKSPHPAEAQRFVTFLGSREAQTILGEKGAVIPAMEGLQTQWQSSIADMRLQVFLDAVDYGVPLPTTAKGLEWSTKVDEVLQEAWLGNLPREQICGKINQAANEALAMP
jgi:multiple sugar transport system substrate-binding protein